MKRGHDGRRLLRLVTGDQAAAVALIIPSVVAVAVFVYGFIGWSAVVSMSEWDTVRPDYTFVGLSNFRDLFENFRFQIDIRNTVVFTVLFVGACLGIGLLLAALLDRRVVGEGIFRSIYLFPMAVSFIVTGVVWRWLLAPRAGVNILPSKVGRPRWVTAGTRTRPSNTCTRLPSGRSAADDRSRLPGRPQLRHPAGDDLRRHRGDVADVRLRDGDVPRRTAGHPGGAARRRPGRRGERRRRFSATSPCRCSGPSR